MAQAIPIGLMVAGTALSAGGNIIGANSQASALNQQAGQLDIAAGQERAASQRAAIDERRQGDLNVSRALALAAASGGGASDPTVVNLMANLSGEAQYRAMTALYNGNQRASAEEADAVTKRQEAKTTKTAGLLKSAGSIISGGASLYDHYGSGGASKASYG